MMTMLRVVALCLVVYVASVVSYDQDACCLGGLRKNEMRDDIWKLEQVESPPPGQMQNSLSCCHLVFATWVVQDNQWTCALINPPYPPNPPQPIISFIEVVCCGACRLRPGFNPDDPNHIPNPWQPNLWPARFGDMMCCIAIPDENVFQQVRCENENTGEIRDYFFKQHTDCQVTA